MTHMISTTAPERAGRHSLFDQFWTEHKGLVFHMAKRLAPVLQTNREELVGSLVIWFNFVLHYYDENKGGFSSYFCRGCYQYLLRQWMRRESQSWSNFIVYLEGKRSDHELSERNYAQHEINFHLYRIPETDETDIDEIVDFFGGLQECWEFMTRKIEPRDRDILTLYFKHGWTLQQLGEKFCISKERVRQLMDRAKATIRTRIEQVQALAHLFAEDEQKKPRGITSNNCGAKATAEPVSN